MKKRRQSMQFHWFGWKKSEREQGEPHWLQNSQQLPVKKMETSVFPYSFFSSNEKEALAHTTKRKIERATIRCKSTLQCVSHFFHRLPIRSFFSFTFQSFIDLTECSCRVSFLFSSQNSHTFFYFVNTFLIIFSRNLFIYLFF